MAPARPSGKTQRATKEAGSVREPKTKGASKPAASTTKPSAAKPRATGDGGSKPQPVPRVAKTKGAPTAGPARLVPDTSVIVDGRITLLVESGEYDGAEIIIPEAVVAELESQANEHRDAGFNGLDELVKLQTMAAKGVVFLRYAGARPTLEEVQLAGAGEIDAMIREVAEAEDATLLTADKVQAQVAEARGTRYRYLRHVEETKGIEDLEIMSYFSEGVMSVHLKQDVPAHGKRGTPGKREYFQINSERLTKRRLNEMARELIEAARRDDRSFVEIERKGASVVQLRDMRIAIARPPFSDAMEITVVRPVAHLSIGDYQLPDAVRARLTDYSRGVFVSGPPGSGKSTFVQAVAEYLHEKGTVVKTMESPRDLQLPDDITQYAPLERDIELTGDFLLLVRPDFVVYDEVRKTRDFEVFADMRLAGVGLIGVTHANRAIDAVQRLIGRVELGMIPQVVDTVVHIVGGQIQQILEMDFTVRVPSGMTEADLARPVIRVRDFQTKQELFEIYTYGEQVVVMPMQAGGASSGANRLAEGALTEMLARHIEGPFEVEMRGGNAATVYVEDWEIASVIGRGGSNVQRLERVAGIKLDIKTMADLRRKGGKPPTKRPPSVDAQWAEEEREERGLSGDNVLPKVRTLKKQVVLEVGPEFGGAEVEITVDGKNVMQGNLSTKGEMKVSRKSPEGKRLFMAQKAGSQIEVRLV